MEASWPHASFTGVNSVTSSLFRKNIIYTKTKRKAACFLLLVRVLRSTDSRRRVPFEFRTVCIYCMAMHVHDVLAYACMHLISAARMRL